MNASIDSASKSLHIYIGPAELCPCPPLDEPFLIICGEQNQASKKLIEKKAKTNKRQENSFEIKNNVIGKSGAEKNWYTFNEPTFNGIFSEKQIDWCNQSIKITTEAITTIKAEKLETLLEQSKLSTNNKISDLKITIAQGDPYLTLKRSKNILNRCIIIDLSLHPLALVWENSINDYLSNQGFKQQSDCLLWVKANNRNLGNLQAMEKPSKSESFLDRSLQALIRCMSQQQPREETYGLSDLQLLQQVVVEARALNNEPSIKKILQTRASKQINKLKTFASQFKKENIKDEIQTSDQTENNPVRQNTTKALAITAKLKGCLDEIEQDLSVTGWVDASSLNVSRSTVSIVWEERQELINESITTIERPDVVAAINTRNSTCGFSIRLEKLEKLELIDFINEKITLLVIEKDTEQLIGDKPYFLDDSIKAKVLPGLVTEKIKNGKSNEIIDCIKDSNNTLLLAILRGRLIELASTRLQAAQPSNFEINQLIHLVQQNPLLDYGSYSEAATRLELTFSAIIGLISAVDDDNLLNQNIQIKQENGHLTNLKALNSKLQERRFLGLQAFENKIWAGSLRPLFDTFIVTLFLQETHKEIDQYVDLIETLAAIAESTYNSPALAYQLRSIVLAKDSTNLDQKFIESSYTRGDYFGYVLAYYGINKSQKELSNRFNYYASLIDLSDNSPIILQHIFNKFSENIGPYLEQNSRQSKPLHRLDRFGFIANNKCQRLTNKMLELNLERESIVDVHQEFIKLKVNIAELLWQSYCPSDSQPKHYSSRHTSNITANWLIIGEKNLEQCWMYRVEQKRTQLLKLGCKVRCIDHEELNYWSITHDILWADSIIFCRSAATYQVFRALSYAKHCNKKVYYEIDDLIFAPEYPADYETYGNSIPYKQYKNLCIDYPLRLGVMNSADEIIVSTQILADEAGRCLEDSSKKIHVLPNLPLEELNQIQITNYSIDIAKQTEPIRIGITTGTLSHKQIIIETIIPVLSRIMHKYLNVSLTVVGYINLPASFNEFGNRVKQISFVNYGTYLNELKACSIVLVPLEVHETTHAKSAIKWMEASYCGAASICSPVKAYTEIATDKITALFAESPDEWQHAISNLIENKELRQQISVNANKAAKDYFNDEIGQKFWRSMIEEERGERGPVSTTRTEKILVINVFFAPQSVGGATRVAQDYVLDMLKDQDRNYDVTILCTDYDHWHADPRRRNDKDQDILKEEQQYKEVFSPTISYWNGARIIRLCIPPKKWSEHLDKDIEYFCDELFQNEHFDRVQCHCCQIITASPLLSAARNSIPYEIIMHDAWWMSPEQFLVSPTGRLIDPGDPLAHFDTEPSQEEKTSAIERREDLYEILQGAERRIAVSTSFKQLCENAGIHNVIAQENKFTPMICSKNGAGDASDQNRNNYNLCHIGGMSIHKGYQLLRKSVQLIPQGMPLTFTIIDHSLASDAEQYMSNWNGYDIFFKAPVPMAKMAEFYAQQNALIAPSIWPESFGLVSREAISAGLWVIASDAGALAEPIKQASAKVGRVIPPNDAEALAQAITNLPEDLALCSKLRKNQQQGGQNK